MVLSDDYYSDLLDLEGFDPDQESYPDRVIASEWQKRVIARVLRTNRANVVQDLVECGIVDEELGKCVSSALSVAKDVFDGVAGLPPDAVARFSPRGLATREIATWKEGWRDEYERLLKVEVPVREAWLAKRVPYDDEEALLRFYRETESYIWELMAANNQIQTLYSYAVTLDKLEKLGCHEFVDYGAGIGTFVLAGVRRGLGVRHLELNSKTMEFARWRYARRGIKLACEEISGRHDDVPESPAIVCLEVVEHVFRPLELLDAFTRAVPKDGLLVVSESCAYLDKFISHLPSSKWLAAVFDEELAKRGFYEVLPEPRVHPRIFRKES